MGRKADISPTKKASISTLLQLGQHSAREIARREGVSHPVVLKLAKNMKENIPIEENKRRNCRRPRKTTSREDRKILSTALQHRRLPAREIKKELEASGINLSLRTLGRRFSENNLKCRRPVKKPRLTPRMKSARLKWAKDHKSFTVEQWKKVGIHNFSS